jgi:hypothetical protein
MRRRSGRIIATAQRVGYVRAPRPEHPGFYQTLWSFMYVIGQHYTGIRAGAGRSRGIRSGPFTFSAISHGATVPMSVVLASPPP